jgi:F-type H+-transporting ATPase subunit delta
MKKISKTTKGVVSGFISYLSNTHQDYCLPEVTDQLQHLINQAKDVKKIVITSTVNLTKDQITQAKKIIINLLGIDVPVENKINKNLLGGLTISVGDWLLDASLSRQLINLKTSLNK